MESRPNLGISKEVIAQKGNTPLHLAVLQNNIEMVEALLNSGVKNDIKNALGQTAFELACELGHYDCAEKFESLLSEYVDTTDGKYGRLFLYAISHYSQLDIARRLYMAGASTSARTRDMKYTALHAAVLNFHMDAVEFLLNIQASLTAKDQYGRTPIQLACQKEYWKCAERLISIIDPSKMTSKQLADLLLECLGNAITAKRIETIKLLLEHGAPINGRDDHFGNYVLWDAIVHAEDKPEILMLLLEHGADPNMRNKDGKNMRELAMEMKKYSMANILSAYDSGPPPEIVNGFVTEIDSCFQKLFSPDNHAVETLAYLVLYQYMIHDLFALDIKALSAKRNLLNLNKDKHEEEIAVLEEQIATLLHLQNYPEARVKMDGSFIHSAVGNHIADHLERLEHIQQYLVRVKEYLVALKGRIDGRHWQIKSFLEVFTNKWHDGIPTHIDLIKTELNKLKAESGIADTLTIYFHITKILYQMKPDSCRHVDTAAFYQQEKKNIESLHFMPQVVASSINVLRVIN